MWIVYHEPCFVASISYSLKPERRHDANQRRWTQLINQWRQNWHLDNPQLSVLDAVIRVRSGPFSRIDNALSFSSGVDSPQMVWEGAVLWLAGGDINVGYIKYPVPSVTEQRQHVELWRQVVGKIGLPFTKPLALSHIYDCGVLAKRNDNVMIEFPRTRKNVIVTSFWLVLKLVFIEITFAFRRNRQWREHVQVIILLSLCQNDEIWWLFLSKRDVIFTSCLNWVRILFDIASS